VGLDAMSTTRYMERRYVLRVASSESTLGLVVSEELDMGRIASR
jgi:hypothetical protein